MSGASDADGDGDANAIADGDSDANAIADADADATVDADTDTTADADATADTTADADADATADATDSARDERRARALRFVAAVLLPWAVVLYPGGGYAVFALGWVDPARLSAVTLPGYLAALGGTLPPVQSSWLLGTGFLLVAVASASLSRIGAEDRRVTDGLLALSGVAVALFAVRLSLTQPGVTALPVGTPLLWGLAWLDWTAR